MWYKDFYREQFILILSIHTHSDLNSAALIYWNVIKKTTLNYIFLGQPTDYGQSLLGSTTVLIMPQK